MGRAEREPCEDATELMWEKRDLQTLNRVSSTYEISPVACIVQLLQLC
jgi:hypothetical protein